MEGGERDWMETLTGLLEKTLEKKVKLCSRFRG
jgi:hypothetical protein